MKKHEESVKKSNKLNFFNMKHRLVKDMLKDKNLLAEDIAQYAVMNSSDNDHVKTANIIDLINRSSDLHHKSKLDSISDEKISDGSNKTYVLLGHNAYFANGFSSAIEWFKNELKK